MKPTNDFPRPPADRPLVVELADGRLLAGRDEHGKPLWTDDHRLARRTASPTEARLLARWAGGVATRFEDTAIGQAVAGGGR